VQHSAPAYRMFDGLPQPVFHTKSED